MKGCNPEPLVGIFWLVGKHLVMDTTPLSEAGKYGDFKIHDGDHVSHWEVMEKRGEVPRDSDYEEHPRGRSNFNTKTQRFTLFADACILRKKNVVAKLMSVMHLPDDTALSYDNNGKLVGEINHFRTTDGKSVTTNTQYNSNTGRPTSQTVNVSESNGICVVALIVGR